MNPSFRHRRGGGKPRDLSEGGACFVIDGGISEGVIRIPQRRNRDFLTHQPSEGIIDEGTGIESINVGGYAKLLRGRVAGEA
jgi:hypothetical protein